MDSQGKVRLHKRLRCEPEALLRALEPYRSDLVMGSECIFCWYWLADLCAREGIAFVLGHALYMKAIHGAKAKNDDIDSHKTAVLLRGGAFLLAYVYPRDMRATRDLLRRRQPRSVTPISNRPSARPPCSSSRTTPAARLISRSSSAATAKGKALSILAARLGRATYFMLKNSEDFDIERFHART